MKKEEAKKILADVNPECCFWVNNGPVVKNLEELSNTLPGISNEAFMHHVNKEKNDFSSWVRDILGDKILADDLMKSKTKQSVINKVKQRLQVLKRSAG